MKILFIGGPLDGQFNEINETVSPFAPPSIKVTLPDGLIVHYHVNFFSGEKVQFPLALYEGLGADDVFKLLLSWYSIKPRVRPVAPADQSSPASETPSDDIITP